MPFRLRHCIAALFIIIGVILLMKTYEERAVFFAAADELGPMTYPRYLLWAWLGLSVIYAFVPTPKQDFYAIRRSLPMLAAALAIIVVYVVLFKVAGLLLSTFVFLLLFFWLLDYRQPLKMLSVALVSAVMTWLVFEKLLGISMPSGWF